MLGFRCSGAAVADDGKRGGIARVYTLTPDPAPLPTPSEVFRQRSHVRSSDRWRVARLCLLHEWGSGSDWRGILGAVRQIQAEAKRLVLANWNAISYVAHELQQHGQIDGEGVRMALYQALADSSAWAFAGALTA